MTELLPTEQAHGVRQGLLDYLTTTFALADQDARLALSEFLEDSADGIFKGPYLRLRLAVPGRGGRVAADAGLAAAAGAVRSSGRSVRAAVECAARHRPASSVADAGHDGDRVG